MRVLQNVFCTLTRDNTMKTILLSILLFLPITAFADKYQDMQSSLREILIAMSQVTIQGKDAVTYSSIQSSLSKTYNDLGDLQKEYNATRNEVMECKAKLDTEAVKK